MALYRMLSDGASNPAVDIRAWDEAITHERGS
jgi:hypothetical protein